MKQKIKIGIIGDYSATEASHKGTQEALEYTARALGKNADITWLATQELEHNAVQSLKDFQALFCAPGSPYQSLEGALKGIRFARENRVPFLAACAGFQHVVVEYARNVLGIKNAEHEEYNPPSGEFYICRLPSPMVRVSAEVRIKSNTQAHEAYQKERVQEKYLCRFGMNLLYQEKIEKGGLSVSGTDREGRAQIFELPSHPFFIAALFHPELSLDEKGLHPLFMAYLRSTLSNS